MTTLEVITLGIAIVGAGLGIMNTWKSFDRDRIKLVVVPKAFARTKQGIIISSNSDAMTENMSGFCIEVVNLSAFALTISEVGFQLRNGHRAVLSKHVLNDQSMLPQRIEPHASVTVFSSHPLGEVTELLWNANMAYATTESGVLQTGTSPFFRSMIRKAKKIRGLPTVTSS
jgi:hypothetical protein